MVPDIFIRLFVNQGLSADKNRGFMTCNPISTWIGRFWQAGRNLAQWADAENPRTRRLVTDPATSLWSGVAEPIAPFPKGETNGWAMFDPPLSALLPRPKAASRNWRAAHSHQHSGARRPLSGHGSYTVSANDKCLFRLPVRKQPVARKVRGLP